MNEESKLKELRIVLSAGATNAYEAMIARMKEDVTTIKATPSHFVSFLVADFFAAHFEKDKAVLIAEFFDSDAFYEAARKKAKGSPNYEELMAEALESAQRLRGKKRRSSVRKGRQKGKESGAALA